MSDLKEVVAKKDNGKDPFVELVEILIDRVDTLIERVEELTEKVNNISTDYEEDVVGYD